MPKKKIELSIKPAKIFFFLVAIVAILMTLFFLKKPNTLKTGTGQFDESEKEVILPRETGVADSGFEQKNAAVTVLNAKTTFDNLEEISGNYSLKISFADRPTASVKIKGYLNSIEEGKFYRLSFWARTNSEKEKNIIFNMVEGGKTQDLGSINLGKDKNTRYHEFNFQANNSAEDLVLTSTDSVPAEVWLDDFLAESLDVNSVDEMKNIQPTVFGDTSWKNTEQSQTESDQDSGKFMAEPGSKIGQIFKPGNTFLSGAAFKIQKVGDGGDGTYKIQLREYDEKLGIISEQALAFRNIYLGYSPSVKEEMDKKEQEMRDEFNQKEGDIKAGRIPNDETTDQYPPTYTQKQIDDDKAAKRKDKLEVAIGEMKDSYNVPRESEIPISARLDISKKYWIGIDNSGVKVDANNYIKVFGSTKAGDGKEPGYVSDAANTWKESNVLWFKTFYPRHGEVKGNKIMSGATLSDFGAGRMIYRYQFNGQDVSSLSGFPERKIFDMYEGNFTSSDANGNYLLSGPDQYVIYKFDTFYPAKKITIRDIIYNQSLGIDFSTDGENWQEVVLENPSENNQKVDPFTITPETESPVFYLRMKPNGNDSMPSSLSLEAELSGCGNSGCGENEQINISQEQQEPEQESNSQTVKVTVYNGSETKGLAAAISDKISAVAGVEVVKKTNAKGSYDKNIIIDLSGSNASSAEEIAATINGEIGDLPDGEVKPDGADILVIGASL